MQTRSFCYVDDLIDGIIRLLFSDEHHPVNIGNPVETTILEFAETINRLVKNPGGIIYKPGQRGESDPQRRRPDITRAQQILNWEPKVPLEDGLLKTIPYFQNKLELA
jgi:dTDP-glucose 4,6-dehydratase